MSGSGSSPSGPPTGAPPEYRAQVDFRIDFTNGGGMQGQGYRLDIPAADTTDAHVGTLLVRELGLLMVAEVRITARTTIAEPHRRRARVPSRSQDEGRRIVELSHVIRDGLVTYPGLPAPTIEDHLSREASRSLYAPGTEFQIGRITMVANTGTYVDTPWHRYPDGLDLAQVSLDSLVELDGVVVDVRGSLERAVGPEVFLPYAVAGRAVLVLTDWSRHFGTPAYLSGHPFLTGAAAAFLVDAGATLVGIDSLNIDDIGGGERPAHSALLGAGVPICEHLTALDRLPTTGFRFSAAPARVAGMGTFPVRAYAMLDRRDVGPVQSSA
jgi:arylformamidase